MSKQFLLLGDTNIVDIKLWLIDSNGVDRKGNHLYLHSQVLRKYEFYKTMLSERRPSDKWSLEVEVTSSQSVDIYIKCIKIMYSSKASKSLRFSFVDEA